MRFGFIKAALAVPRVIPGAPKKNLEQIEKAVLAAVRRKAEIIAFGEMSLSGITLGSMLHYDSLLDEAENALAELRGFSKDVPAVIIVGLPVRLAGKVVSAAAVVASGALHGLAVSSEHSGEIDILGGMCPIGNNLVFDMPALDTRFAVVLGEDFDRLSPHAAAGACSGAELIVNISAGKALIDSYEKRMAKITAESERLICAYMYVSSGDGESVARNVYCGDKIAISEGETVSAAEGGHGAEIIYAELDTDSVRKARRAASREECIGNVKRIIVPAVNLGASVTREIDDLPFVPASAEFDRIIDIMGRGIYTRMREAKTDKVIFGLSGGLDSAMVLLACEIMFRKNRLDPKNIIAVTMSGQASSTRTKGNAQKLIAAFRVTNIDIPIVQAVESHLADIGHSGKTDTVYENAQARERAQILLNLSNKHSALMLGTGNLSETALGWSTYGGDQVAHYNPNSSLSKTLIKAILRNYCLTSKNSAAAKTVNDILATPISPELLPNQSTEYIIGPYELHDFFLFNLIGKGFKVDKTVYLCEKAFSEFSRADILKYLKIFISRFFKNQFKRSAGCDGIQVTSYDLSEKVIYSEFSDEIYLQELEKLSK